MSIIRDIVNSHITGYNNAKIGKWDKPEPPPEQVFGLNELYIIGEAIIRDIEGKLSDKIIREDK